MQVEPRYRNGLKRTYMGKTNAPNSMQPSLLTVIRRADITMICRHFLARRIAKSDERIGFTNWGSEFEYGTPATGKICLFSVASSTPPQVNGSSSALWKPGDDGGLDSPTVPPCLIPLSDHDVPHTHKLCVRARCASGSCAGLVVVKPLLRG